MCMESRKMVQMILWQGRNREEDIMSRYVHIVGEEVGGMNCEIGIHVYTLLCVK